MCAQFMIKARIESILKRFRALIDGDVNPDDIAERILPYMKAPVIVGGEKNRALRMMQFSLVPSWSKDRRVKFATHNARLDSIDTKPTWRGPFARMHCLVPLTDFIEPIYDGEFAGHMVRFRRSDGELLAACGIFDRWSDPKSGIPLESFAVVTDTPSPFVERIGHDRQPVFLGEESWDTWLRVGESDAAAQKSFLTQARFDPELVVEKDRPMKAGWEKRKKAS